MKHASNTLIFVLLLSMDTYKKYILQLSFDHNPGKSHYSQLLSDTKNLFYIYTLTSIFFALDTPCF